jgi:thiamine biosynthesis lipoprotein
LGTKVSVVVSDAASVGNAQRLIEHQVDELDLACSRFREDSELARVNRAAGSWTEVSALFLEALQESLRAARLTDGKVDPTIGRALRLAGYDRDFAQLPEAQSRRLTFVATPGWRSIDVDHERGAVRVARGVELDLGATAKAFAADRAAHSAAAATGSGVLVNLGGDVAMAGESPPGGWSVRVTEDHAAGADAPGQTVAIVSGGVATSSTTVRRWTNRGEPLHHIVDPATGRPARVVWRTVSVAAGSCVDANTASTAAIVQGVAAPAWLDGAGMAARLIAADGTVLRLGGWPEESAE